MKAKIGLCRAIALLLLVLAAMPMSAQEVYPNLARIGGKGIFVFTAQQIPDTRGPLTGYTIERKAEGDKDFAVVTQLTATPDFEAFVKNAEQSLAWLPYRETLAYLRLDSIWNLGKSSGTLDELGFDGYNLAVLAGFNMAWLDETATDGQVYTYRVSAIGVDHTIKSLPIRFTGLPYLDSLQFAYSSYYFPHRSMELRWLATGQEKPVVFETFRSEAGGKFAQIDAKATFIPQNDTMVYVLEDTTAIPGQLYRYYLNAYDALGAAAPITDTVSAASLDYVQMPLPRDIRTEADTSGYGIRIHWELPSATLINGVTLYRSTNSVDGFEPVAVLSPDVTEYVDQDAQPATPYFYYFEATYKTIDEPKRGIGFAGSYMDQQPPAMADDLQAEGNADGVALTWRHKDRNTSGFWLYRAEPGKELQQVGGLIPAVDTVSYYTYTDTDSLLSGGTFYYYALKAYSTSHVESAFSDTAMARPLKNIPIPKPPINVDFQYTEGKTWLSWDDATAYDEHVSGYWVLRSPLDATAAGQADTIFVANNLFVDSLQKAGASYRYRVVAQSIWGVQSAPSAGVTYWVKSVQPAAPGQLTANLVGRGIQLNWEPPADAASLQYHIYRYERGNAAAKLAESPVGSDYYVDKTVVSGRHYFYFVRAVDAGGAESRNSNEAGMVY